MVHNKRSPFLLFLSRILSLSLSRSLLSPSPSLLRPPSVFLSLLSLSLSTLSFALPPSFSLYSLSLLSLSLSLSLLRPSSVFLSKTELSGAKRKADTEKRRKEVFKIHKERQRERKQQASTSVLQNQQRFLFVSAKLEVSLQS